MDVGVTAMALGPMVRTVQAMALRRRLLRTRTEEETMDCKNETESRMRPRDFFPTLRESPRTTKNNQLAWTSPANLCSSHMA